MPKFLFHATYTIEGEKGVRSAGGSARRDAVAHLAESVGAKLEEFYFTLDGSEAYVVIDAPDTEAAAAAALIVNASGGATVKTVVLLTPEEIDAASHRGVEYVPPGG